MSERANVQIRIAGHLEERFVPGLWSAAKEDAVGFEWGECSVGDVHEFAEALSSLVGPLFLRNEAARGGTLGGVTAFCRRRGLSYVETSGASSAWDPELTWWAPGMPEKGGWAMCDNAGVPVISTLTLSEALERRDDGACVREISRLVDLSMPPSMPKTLTIISPD